MLKLVYGLEPLRMSEKSKNKDGAKCGGAVLKNIQLRLQNGQQTHARQGLTRDILLREVKLFGFMKNIFNLPCLSQRFLFIFCI